MAGTAVGAEWRPGEWPVLRKYDAAHVRAIALPLGGLGTGSVSLGGRGELRDWEIMNRPAKGYFGTGQSIDAPCFVIRAQRTDGTALTRLAAGPISPDEYLHMEGRPVPNHGLPRFAQATFEAAFPFGTAVLTDPSLPVRVRVKGFSPFVPGDVASSSLPFAALVYEVENLTDETLDVSLCGLLRNFIGADGSRYEIGWKGEPIYQGAKGNRNAFADGKAVRGIRFLPGADVPKTDAAWGAFALVTDAPQESVSFRTSSATPRWNGAILDFWDDFSADGVVSERPANEGEDDPMAALCVKKSVPARTTATYAFYLTWAFPNRLDWEGKTVVGNHYTGVWPEPFAAAEKIVPQLPALEAKTRDFVRKTLSADAPDVLKEAALFNLAVYKSQTVFRLPSGHLMAWEGVMDRKGSCKGSCTHVWNYDDATANLFPELARTMRDIEFNYATHTNGLMSFRAGLPLDRAADDGKPAADGQMGCIVKAYREWRRCGDDAWLRAIWPKVRLALSFCWAKDGTWNWDADEDGVMDGRQHNTMDVDYYGPNPQMQFWYLAALKAGAKMAAAVGDAAFAARCEKLFANGSMFAEARLFNGEYYDQLVPDGDRHDFQIGKGCLVDQLVGDTVARLSGLGAVADPKHARAAIASVWKYNHRDDMAGEFRHQRSYALAGEGGLLMATWPHGGREKFPFPYFSEVMTGFEYVAATEMVFLGLRDEALRAVRDVRDRHDGLKRNPFSEPECGHHYGRSLAAWGTFRAWTEE